MAAKDKSEDPVVPATQPEAGQQAQPIQIVPTPTVPPPPDKELDEAKDGPRFIVNGQLVNAEGQPINEDGSLKKQSEA